MRTKLLIGILALVALTFGHAYCIPTLFVNGVAQNCLGDLNENVNLSFTGHTQTWTLVAEYSAWAPINNFGVYFDNGATSLVFSGASKPGMTTTTALPSNSPIGLWLCADLNRNACYDGQDHWLSSTRNAYPTIGTLNNAYQYFHVYDVRAFRGLGYAYEFATYRADVSTTGDYDYLIYIDDSGSRPDYDHNDLVIGVSAGEEFFPVPEPASLLLLGAGLALAVAIRLRFR